MDIPIMRDSIIPWLCYIDIAPYRFLVRALKRNIHLPFLCFPHCICCLPLRDESHNILATFDTLLIGFRGKWMRSRKCFLFADRETWNVHDYFINIEDSLEFTKPSRLVGSTVLQLVTSITICSAIWISNEPNHRFIVSSLSNIFDTCFHEQPAQPNTSNDRICVRCISRALVCLARSQNAFRYK